MLTLYQHPELHWEEGGVGGRYIPYQRGLQFTSFTCTAEPDFGCFHGSFADKFAKIDRTNPVINIICVSNV